MFGLVAFAEYPFALLPNSGPITIVVGITESLTATDAYIGLDNHAYLTEGATASDSLSGGINYVVSVSESVTASDVYQTPFDEVASLFGFTPFAAAPIAGLTIVRLITIVLLLLFYRGSYFDCPLLHSRWLSSYPS